MGSHKKNIYIFITDEAKNFYRATQNIDGSYTISYNKQPYPISYNPTNLEKVSFEFGTNMNYFSLNRSVVYPLDFIKDGAAILRNLYYSGNTVNQRSYLTIVQWNGSYHELSYYGRIDFTQKKEDPKSGLFTVSCIDDSAWGVLSQKDDIPFAIECNSGNPKAIRVLFDGINLTDKYTFQTVQVACSINREGIILPFPRLGFNVPLVLVNQDGDSVGVITKTVEWHPASLVDGYFFNNIFTVYNVSITGTIKFLWDSTTTSILEDIRFSLDINDGNSGSFFIGPVFTNPAKLTEYSFNFSISDIHSVISGQIRNNGKLYIIAEINSLDVDKGITITFITTNIELLVHSKQEAVVAYGLRPLDLAQLIVEKSTGGRFTIGSNFFGENKNSILLSGDSIRGEDDSKIYTSFKDFFQSFNSMNFMALRDINGDLYIEKAIEVYKNTGNIIDIGEAIDLQLEPANDFYANQIEVGYPNIDLRHPSGRLEFNTTNKFSLDIQSYNKKLDLVSKYRGGCYDIQFLIMDYKNSSTKDNSGDKSVFIAEITDELGVANDLVETFENITFDVAPLQPYIISPLSDDYINNSLPTIKGIAPPGSNINIYLDDILDGNTTSDSTGNWSYDSVTPLTPYDPIGTDTGIHTVKVSYTDLIAPFSSITINITNSTDPIVSKITYPTSGDYLYNNKPLIKGIAQAGTSIPITINGVLVTTVISDGSCRWTYKSPVLPNGSNTINIVDDISTFNVDTAIDFPLITFIDRELDGNIVINSLPLIEGIAKPGTVVQIWFNYISNSPVNTVPNSIIADSNGNWSFQTVPVDYPDPITHLLIVLVPFQNGVGVISTLLVNESVKVSVTGYKLNRPEYSSITGVNDNTVFNTTISPKRNLLNHLPLLSAMTKNNIDFQTSDKNPNLRTVLDGVVISERDNVQPSSLWNPLVVLEWVNLKVKAKSTFAKTLYNFNNGGLIKASFRGSDLYMLPIGNMKIDTITSDVQEWKLLLSPQTSYSTLLNLYNNGLTITLMDKAIYHSDYNTLHFVSYNFQKPVKYNSISHYDDWFENRNDFWLESPIYIQKMQKGLTIIDQIIVNGVSGMFLQVCRCLDSFVVDTIYYNPVTPAPIPSPDIVYEASIDFSIYPEDQYFFLLCIIVSDEIKYLAISERIQTKETWERSILIEASSSINKTGSFFSTGFKTVICVEGIVKKLQPNAETIVSTDDIGDSQLLYSKISRMRQVRFGNAYGLPDYLYLKIADAITLDVVTIDGVLYTIAPDEKINPSEEVEGHPLFYYNVNMLLSENNGGKGFLGDDTGSIDGVVLVVDAVAFGLPTGSLINITLD